MRTVGQKPVSSTSLPAQPAVQKPAQQQAPVVSKQPTTSKTDISTFVGKADAAQGPTQLSSVTTTTGQKAIQSVGDKPVEKKNAKYDYVIIGAGAGGAPLAARLAEQGYKVLVLEGGKDKPVKETEVPAFHGKASESPDVLAHGTGYNVDHFTSEADQHADPKAQKDGSIFYPRGQGIGGSTRMNAQIFVKVDDVDWDNIAKLTGDPEWRHENMNKYFTKLEKNEYRPVLKLLDTIGKKLGISALQNGQGHGFDGWLETTRPDAKLLLQDKQLLRIVAETGKYSFKELGSVGEKLKRLVSLFDPNDNRTNQTEGLTITPLSVTKDGRRNGPRDRLLSAAEAHPDKLTIKSGVEVENVVMNDKQEVIGVRYKDESGKSVVEPVGREAIISAGAFGTPEVLMRSGIGPKEELDKLKDKGVAPQVILPGVGKSLSDRYEVGVVTRMKKPFGILKDAHFKADPSDPAYKKWEETGKGLYSSNGAVIAFQAKSDPGLKDPDLYIFGVPGDFHGYYRGYSDDAVKDDRMFTWLILDENKGDKHGEVTLDASNPEGPGKANFMYHKEESRGDSVPVVAGVKMVRQLISQYSDLVEEEVWPGKDAKTDEDLAKVVEANSWGHHANGTARMGKEGDPMAVVDSNFKVMGTKGLRVVDASVFPDNVGSFIVSGVMQISEKAADDIVEDAKKEDAAKKKTGVSPLFARFADI